MRKERDFFEMVARARDGDQESMSAILAEGREKALRSFQRQRFGADDAQDLAQEFTVRLWQAVTRLRNERGFWKLAWAVARGVTADELRRRCPCRLFPTEVLVELERPERTDTITVRGERVDRHWLLVGLDAALAQLPAPTRRLFSGQLGGHRLKSLAAARRVSESSVKIRLYRGRRRLRSLLEDRVANDWWGGEHPPSGEKA
jgi:RNA polymerase sigma factor (sigma-70 family)